MNNIKKSEELRKLVSESGLGESVGYRYFNKRLEIRVKFNEFPINIESHRLVDKIRDSIESEGFQFYDMCNVFKDINDLVRYENKYSYTVIVFDELENKDGV